MKNFKEFISAALEGNGVENDSQDAWVTVDGCQYTVPVSDMLDNEETEPFEASYVLEENLKHPVWEGLYEQYKTKSEN